VFAALLPVYARVFAGQSSSRSRADHSVYGTVSSCGASALSPLTPARLADTYVRMRQMRQQTFIRSAA
jgi:hypothetical protein